MACSTEMVISACAVGCACKSRLHRHLDFTCKFALPEPRNSSVLNLAGGFVSMQRSVRGSAIDHIIAQLHSHPCGNGFYG